MTIEDALLLAGAIICAIATWRGSVPERALASVLFADLLLEAMFAELLGGEFATQHLWLYAILELGLLVLVSGVALRANRVYPLWIGGAQIIAVSSHALLQILGTRAAAACQAIDISASMVTLIAMASGLWSHTYRQRRLHAPYPDWTHTSDRVGTDTPTTPTKS